MPKKYVKFGDKINLEKYFKVWGEQVTLHIAIDGIDGIVGMDAMDAMDAIDAINTIDTMIM